MYIEVWPQFDLGNLVQLKRCLNKIKKYLLKYKRKTKIWCVLSCQKMGCAQERTRDKK